MRLRLAVLLALFSVAAFAATYRVPSDADLIRAADAIAIVVVQSAVSSYDLEGRIVTDSVMRVERAIKGSPPAGRLLTVRQLGGAVGDRAMYASAHPAYVPGERALVMLAVAPRGGWTTLGGELGKFTLVRDVESRALAVRGASEGEIFGWDLAGRPHEERARDAERFVAYVERVLAGASEAPDYLVVASDSVEPIRAESHASPSEYVSLFGFTPPRGARWPEGGFTMFSVGTQTGVSDLPGAIDASRNVWNDVPESAIEIGYGGPAPGAPTPAAYGEDDERFLLFLDQRACTTQEVNDNQCPLGSRNPLAGTTVGQANVWANSRPIEVEGVTFATIVDCDIVIEQGMSGNLFQQVVAHEMGHCIGYRHSNQPGTGQTINTTQALMNSSVTPGGSATLRDYDRDAATHVYPDVCHAPEITSQPVSRAVQAGTPTSIEVTAEGGEGFQWYRGESGDTSDPILAATGRILTTGPVTEVASFWVRVTNACGSVDSATATVAPTTARRRLLTGRPG